MLSGLLAEATSALELLDAGRLDELAGRLETLVARSGGLVVTAEIAARHRVFASVLRATGENLNILKRVARGAGEESAWVR